MPTLAHIIQDGGPPKSAMGEQYEDELSATRAAATATPMLATRR